MGNSAVFPVLRRVRAGRKQQLRLAIPRIPPRLRIVVSEVVVEEPGLLVRIQAGEAQVEPKVCDAREISLLTRRSRTPRTSPQTLPPTSPIPRPPALMSDGDDHHRVGVPPVDDRVGEPANQHPPPRGAHRRTSVGMLADEGDRAGDLARERFAKARPSCLVVIRCVSQFGLRVRMEGIRDQRSR